MRNSKAKIVAFATAAVAALGLSAQTRAADDEPKKEELTDAQLIGVLLEANTSSVAYNQLAAARIADEDVRDFALDVAADHYKASRRLVMYLEKNQGAEFADSDARKEMTATFRENFDAVWVDAPGDNFDRAFVENKIEGYTHAIEGIELAIQGTDDKALRRELMWTRDVLEGNLEEACDLVGDVGGSDRGCDVDEPDDEPGEDPTEPGPGEP